MKNNNEYNINNVGTYVLFFIQLFAMRFKNWKWFIYLYIVIYDIRLIFNVIPIIFY